MQSSSSEHRELTGVLRSRRTEVAQAFAEAIAHTPKWRGLMEGGRADWAGFLHLHFFVFADYLIEYFDRGEESFKHLFVGEALKGLYDPDLSDAAMADQAVAVAVGERTRLEALLRSELSDSAWVLLETHLADVHRTIGAKGGRTQRLLLVGDCLFLDIVPFITGALLRQGITLIVDYATSKNPLELRDQLRAFSTRKFDLVFFSPFTYEFSLAYNQLSDWRNALQSQQRVHEVVEEAWAEAKPTLDLMADLFDCAIHVHNSSAVVREEHPVRRRLRLTATARVRSLAKHEINGLLSGYVLQRNAQSFRHLFVVDENALVAEAGEFEAGAYLYRAELQHPAVLGQMLAPAYADIVSVNTWLAKRKLVVCDLDNTLWDGLIGEGVVRHHHDRQRALQALRRKGVVLAIASKNDPANVHWRGGSLSDDDFVYSAVSWGPKVQAMTAIHAELNLKTKDSVFIDDRQDELTMMRLAHPDLVCLDANDPATWRRISLWEASMDDDPDMDRTLMYRQREARKAHVAEQVTTHEEEAALFASLGLELTISQAQASDLKRVAELINRTNQFNLEGSRTSYTEVMQWHDSANHFIVTAQTADRFGDMGTTCVAVARVEADRMVLMPFVLSCRVFGYGIERSVMNFLKRVAMAADLSRIVARFASTPQNAPCRGFLEDNGFTEEAGVWTFAALSQAEHEPAWLRITITDTATGLLARKKDEIAH